MARVARKHMITRQGGFFHVLNRISGFPGDYPFQNPQVISDFIWRLRYSLHRSCIHCAAFVLMGNHYHLILFAEQFRKLSRRKLEGFAQARWGRLWRLRTGFWADQRWEKFNQELFDLSGFMRDFQGPFTTWFNKTFGRRGRLWADRFKCLALGDDLTAMQEQLLYVELNPVRAYLTSLPEEWEAGSAYLRSIGQGDFLIPLEEIFPDLARPQLEPFYRGMLLYRGMNPRREDQAAIPAEVVARELRRGFPPGLYLKRCRFMIDGLFMGSREQMIRKLEQLTQEGLYQQKRNATEHLSGLFHTVREQRSHCRW